MRARPCKTRVIQTPIADTDPEVIRQAADIIGNGGLVVYPTDTFYGLGGNPANSETIKRIFEVKGRPSKKPLPLIIDHRDRLKDYVLSISPLSERLIEQFWPGPLTLIFHARPCIPDALTANTGKIAIRWPIAPIATRIVKMADTAIISTSANLSQKGGIVSPDDILRDLDGLVDLVIDAGELPYTLGSTIADATADRIEIIREGDLPADALSDMD